MSVAEMVQKIGVEYLCLGIQIQYEKESDRVVYKVTELVSCVFTRNKKKKKNNRTNQGINFTDEFVLLSKTSREQKIAIEEQNREGLQVGVKMIIRSQSHVQQLCRD